MAVREPSETPRLTVKSFAEMLRLPAYELSRRLYDQKYPDEEPQNFRAPYYQKAIAGIRNYYRSGNDKSALTVAASEMESIGNATRRTYNRAILQKFMTSPQARRKLKPTSNTRYAANLGPLEVRLSADLQGLEAGERRVIYYNCRNVPMTSDIAEPLIEIAFWVLRESQQDIHIGQIEVVDFASGQVHHRKALRASTLKALKGNAEIIAKLWPSL